MTDPRPTTPSEPGRPRIGRRLRLVLVIAAVLVVIAPITFLWQRSLTGSRYSMMTMGYPDYGGGVTGMSTAPGADSRGMSGMTGRGAADAISITTLVPDPRRRADVTVDLIARQQNLTIAGTTIHGYTLNGRSPGPTITARIGQLIQVNVHNASVTGGMTLHWHGVDVPDAEDGTAGVTQDDIPVGGDFTYRFVANAAGTYWYHSHQSADAQVAGGLLGALIILPARPIAVRSVISLFHTYGAVSTLNGAAGDQHVAARPGERIRVRVINTDNGPIPIWSTTPYTVAAIDGTDLHGPTPVTDHYLSVTAGGRADVTVTAPTDGSSTRVQVSAADAVIIGGQTGDQAATDRAAQAQPETELDLLHYGIPAPLGFDPAKADRHFTYSIGRQVGFIHGKPGIWWSINGHLYPDVPMFVVRTGDIVIMTISNHSGDVHPMHLHGHHEVVLSRNGVPSTGSPWWVDSLNIRNGETYRIAFVADNPGLWMDHCHNLTHAAQGMVAHLMYAGYRTPFMIGGPTGNNPE